MALHPQCRAALDALAAARPRALEEQTPEEARAARAAALPAVMEMAGPAETVFRVEDCAFGNVPARLYRPSAEANLPVLVYFHGGGWVLGDLDTVDRPCRALANRSGCAVVSVAYRLAPEHRFPAAVDDALAATGDIARRARELGFDAGRIGVGGDSAGANLAAAVTLRSRDAGWPPIAFQLLIYPVVDYDDNRPSLNEYSDGHLLTRSGLEWFWGHYVANAEQGRHVWASPLNAELAGLPPAFVITAECDPLRDQGEAYASKLKAAGVAVGVKSYPGAIHAFFQMGGVIDAGREAVDDAAGAIRRAFAGRTL